VRDLGRICSYATSRVLLAVESLLSTWSVKEGEEENPLGGILQILQSLLYELDEKRVVVVVFWTRARAGV
jgi:hypothetical protein